MRSIVSLKSSCIAVLCLLALPVMAHPGHPGHELDTAGGIEWGMTHVMAGAVLLAGLAVAWVRSRAARS